MTTKLLLTRIAKKIREPVHMVSRYRSQAPKTFAALNVRNNVTPSETCTSCGMLPTSRTTREEIVTHNPHTCMLVNLVLREMRVTMQQRIRIEIYPDFGPLRGFYSTADPYAIHISDQAYSQFPEYIIFHETKHLVDCLTKGWSEEGTPDKFAKDLCSKHGYTWPPPPQEIVPMTPTGLWNYGNQWP